MEKEMMIRCPGCWVTKGDEVEGDITLTVSNGIDAASNGYDGAEKCPVLIEAALDGREKDQIFFQTF